MRSKQKKQKQGMILGRIASIYILFKCPDVYQTNQSTRCKSVHSRVA